MKMFHLHAFCATCNLAINPCRDCTCWASPNDFKVRMWAGPKIHTEHRLRFLIQVLWGVKKFVWIEHMLHSACQVKPSLSRYILSSLCNNTTESKQKNTIILEMQQTKRAALHSDQHSCWRSAMGADGLWEWHTEKSISVTQNGVH